MRAAGHSTLPPACMKEGRAIMQPTTIHDEVKDYYGRVLGGSDDLKTDAACCATDIPPRYVLDVMPLIADEIVERSLKQAAMWDELKDRLNKSALGLSGGQQQRLCIARALAVGPQILLMDEPTSALDPISTGKIEDLCEELKNDVTIVMVTHNMQQAARISDKTAFFLLGEMIEMGDTEQVFSAPKHPETERYITGRFG